MSARDTGSAVEVTVADSGIGIPPVYLGQLFERFKQVPGTREKTGGTKGSGLGLAIAKGIVEAHGGTIRVESEEGTGSRFIFSLPKNAGETVQVKNIFS